MNSKMDPMGRAIADYWKTKKADRLRVFSPMFEEDEIPLKVLFRSYKAMPEIERKALDMATGRTLDVGAASGCHSLVLQKKGIDVTAIDISPLAVETMKEVYLASGDSRAKAKIADIQYEIVWKGTGILNPKTNTITYKSSTKSMNFISGKGERLKTQYQNGSGKFILNGKTLKWNDSVDHKGNNFKFVKL